MTLLCLKSLILITKDSKSLVITKKNSKPNLTNSCYLVLGHKGYIGRNVIKFFESLNLKTQIIDAKINDQNIVDLLQIHSDSNTIIVNCIANGVTLSKETNFEYSINHEILELIINNMGKYDFKGIIHFATFYEKLNLSLIPNHRQSYVISKILGSDICKKNLINANISLIYLPTLISYDVPPGRFFHDFVSYSGSRESYAIEYPYSTINLLCLENFFMYFEKLLNDFKYGVYDFYPNVSLTVLEFSKVLNLILFKLGKAPVEYGIRNDLKQSFDKVSKHGLRIDTTFMECIEAHVKKMLEYSL